MPVVFAVLLGIDVAGIVLEVRALEWAAKPLLAPALAVYLWRVSGTRHPPVLAALGFATAGDTALLVPGTVAFAVGTGFFLGAQVCFTAAFVRAGAVAHLRARPAVTAGYLLVWAAAVAVLAPMLGAGLGTAVAVYALALVATAATAHVLGPLAAWGGAVFLFSDLLVGLGAAGVDFPGRPVLVMLSYGAALVLLVHAVARSGKPRADTPDPPVRSAA